MMQTVLSINPTIASFWHELVFTALIGFLGAVAMWPIKKVKTSYKELMEAMQTINEELITQRTNCLATIQDNGAEQLKALNRVADILDNIHTSQAEMSGFLKAGGRSRE